MNDTKIELRSRLRKSYLALSEFERNEIDGLLIDRFVRHDLFRSAQRIFLYASHGTEINTHHLIQEAFAFGKTIALPKCMSDGIMDFYLYDGVLAEGKYHIPEPIGTEILYPAENDLMIVPGLAFDENGYRIGQGGGYYDRYLSKHNCILVGFCRECNFMKQVPRMWNDLPVDFVITEKAVYSCHK